MKDLKGIAITWLGHGTFHFTTPKGTSVLVDPWVMGNPACPADKKKFDRIDIMLCTHGHYDHIGDAVELGKKHDPKVVGIYELCSWLQSKGVKQIAPMNKGGTQKVGDISVTMVNANHSCGIQDGDQIVYGGEAAGYVIEFENGIRIYHSGDTNVFGDMALIHELYNPDIAIIPIGDHFTMGIKEAAHACKLLQTKTVIPMHFATFPVLTGTPAALKAATASLGVEVVEMKPGQMLQ